MTQKVLVTGANGFLGQWLVRALVAEGHQVTCLLRREPRGDLKENIGPTGNWRLGDVTQPESLLNFQDYDAVFHLAGLIAYRKSDRPAMEAVNVEGTRNIVQACIQGKVKRLVFVSSVVAVGAGFNKEQVLNEESIYNVKDLNLGYFETKHQAEEIVMEASKKGLLDAVVVNPATIYGAGDATKGSRKTQLKVAQGRFKFYTGGGVNVVPVENCVRGILSAWHKGRNGERYILSGQNLTIQELFAEIAKAGGVPAPQWKIPDFALHAIGIFGDFSTACGLPIAVSRENAWTATLFHWFDSAKAQRELGFDPGSSKEAIQKSVAWMREQGMLAK